MEQAGIILVVDDSPEILRLTQKLLNKMGWGVLLASSGEEALEIVKVRDNIDAVFLDLAMPGQDGGETLATIRQIHPRLPVIIMSGFNPLDFMEQAVLKETQGFLGKPFSPEKLERILDNLGRISSPAEEQVLTTRQQ